MNEHLHHFQSVHLDNERAVWVCPPAVPARHLTIFLDGELYRDQVGAPALLAALDAQQAIAPTWVVYVAFEREEFRWRECPCHPPFARFVVDELLPWLEHTYPALRDCPARTLVGLSYTGLAAAYIAHQAPGRFARILAQSGSFWWNEGWLIGQYAAARPHPSTAFYLDVGTKESEENVRHREDVFQRQSQIEATRRFRDVLLGHGCEVNYREFDGGHDCAEWKKTLPAALVWALPPAPRGRS